MTSSPTVPCPMCGSENAAAAAECSVCHHSLTRDLSNIGGTKCARCGSQVPSGYPFCPVCGLDQRQRLPRPPTRLVKMPEDDLWAQPGAGSSKAPVIAHGPAPRQPMRAPIVGPAPESGARPIVGTGVGTGGVESSPYATGVDQVSRPTGSDFPSQTGRTVYVEGPPIPRPPPGFEVPATQSGPAFVPAPVHVQGPGTPGPSGTVEYIIPRLVLVGRDGEEGESFPIPNGVITVGRHQGDVRFPDDIFMSPVHGRVQRSGHGYMLLDHGSTNGTYLRIRSQAPVYPGDMFMLGHQVLRLENIVDPPVEAAPAPDGTRLFGTPLKPAWGKIVLVGRGGQNGDSYYLRGARVVFGREQGDIVFPRDPFVSREHARLRLELHGSQMSVFLEDLDSANGTYVRIRGNIDVQSRDTFRMGDQILRLRLEP